MTRFVGMVIVLAGLAALLVALSGAYYWLAGAASFGAEQLGLPWQYGAAVANLVTLLLVTVMTIGAFLTVAERKWSAMIQDRIGPNRIRVMGLTLGGLPFLVADALKMLTKENTEPASRSRALFNLAPVLAFAPVFALFAIVPVGPGIDVSFTWQGQVHTYRNLALQVASPDAGLLYVFAIASLAVYGTSLAGWASNNKLALLGGVRASSQMISYEVSLGLSLVGSMMAFQSLRIDDLVVGQQQLVWGFFPALGVLLQPVGFLVFFASAFAENKRAPFDLPEGESEIVGYFLEYSGMKFGMFMISEFVEVVIIAGLVTAIFFGGWHPIVVSPETLRSALAGAGLGPIAFGAVSGGIFLVKTLVLCWLQLAIRWALPRFRFDQIQQLCWKMLLPVGLANAFLTGAALLLDPSLDLLAWIGLAEIVVMVAVTTAAARAAEPPAEHAAHGAHGSDAHAPAAHAHGH